MITVTYSLNKQLGLDRNLDITIDEFMSRHGFEDVGDGTGGGKRDLEYSVLSAHDGNDDVTICRANAKEREWAEEFANVEALFGVMKRPFDIKFEPNSVYDEERGDFIQCSEPAKPLWISRGSGI